MLPREALGHLNRSFPGFLTLPISAESDPFPSHLCTWLHVCQLRLCSNGSKKKKKNETKTIYG